jgi:predicted SAM-dependent methyltransferase
MSAVPVPTIRAYLEDRATQSVRGLPRGLAIRLLRRVTTFRFRQWVKLNATTFLLPVAKRRIRRLLETGQAIRLNLGSGPSEIKGWVNVDIVGMSPHIPWDLRRGIPFPDNSVQAVFLEHVCEHFPTADVLDMLQECRRVLAPGGIVRIGVPDFGRYLRSYAGDQAFIEELRPGRPTALLAVAEVALFHGHRSVWDGQTLECVLSEAGFEQARACVFGESALQPAPDTPMREPESVYGEGVKPSD